MDVRAGFISPTTDFDPLLAAHLPLVRAVTNHVLRSLPAQIAPEQAEQAGRLGLRDAARRCDPRHPGFSTFARHYVRGAILDSLSPSTPRQRRRSSAQRPRSSAV